MQNTQERPRTKLGSFYHVSLNTGHVAMQPRTEVADEIVELLRPTVQAGGGDLPLILEGWELTMFKVGGMKSSGFAVNPKGKPSMPAVVGVACWSEKDSKAAWQVAKAKFRSTEVTGLMSMLGMHAPVSHRPPRAPWLAVWPSNGMAMASPAQMFAFGDLERCLAWTMAETL